MRRFVLSLVAAGLLVPSVLAQTRGRPATPPDVHKAAFEAVNYVNKLYETAWPDAVFETDRVLNAPAADIRTVIAKARQEIADERARLASLPVPDLRVTGFDITFALSAVHAMAVGRADSMSAAADALDAMEAARAAGDCVAFADQAAAFDDIRVRMRTNSLWNETRDVQTFLARYAGQRHPPAPAPSPAPNPAVEDPRKSALMADELASQLRCPLFSPDVTFRVQARLSPSSELHVRVVSISDESLRKTIEGRFNGYKVKDPYRFRGWSFTNKTVEFTWANQRMMPPKK